MDEPIIGQVGLVVLGAEAASQRLLAEEAAALSPAVADVTTLASFVDDQFRVFSDFRRSQGIEEQMLHNLRSLRSQYDPDQLAKIEAAGGSKIFMGLTGMKFRHAVAWLEDIFSNEEDKVWGMRPSPLPDLPQDLLMQANIRVQEQIAQLLQGGEQPSPGQVIGIQNKVLDDLKAQLNEDAQRRASAMETEIHDQLLEGGFKDCFSDFLQDLCGLKLGIIKGPVIRMRKRKVWNIGPDGTAFMEVQRVPMPTFERVSPLDAYPSPVATDFSGDFIERQRYSRASLSTLVGLPGYDSLAIQSVLDEFDQIAKGSTSEQLDTERADLEDKESESRNSGKYSHVEGLEGWFSVPGSLCKEFGIEGVAEDTAAYDICVIKIGPHIVYKALNPDPLGRKPYCGCGWCPIPGSFWYFGVPEVMGELQTLGNAAVRSLVNNLALSSGPQVALYDISRLPQGEDITMVYPGKVWQFTNRTNSQTPPIQFFQPDNNANVLLAVWDKAVQLADDWSGIPAYAYGNDQVAGAGRTASGLSMLMSNAAKGIKRVILNIDKRVFKPLIERMYDWNMANNPNPEIKGDLQVETTGAVAIMVKEQMSERRLAILQATNNPTDLQLMGLDGRAELLREALKSVEIPGGRLVKDDEEVERQVLEQQQAEAQAQQQAMQLEQQKLQAQVQKDQMEIQLKQAELALKQAELTQVKVPGAMLKQAELEQVKVPTARRQAELEQARVDNDTLKAYAKIQGDVRNANAMPGTTQGF